MSSSFDNYWAELMFFVLLVIGFLFSVISPSAVLSYFMIFACGMMSGRLLYFRKHNTTMPYVIIIIGFALGYIVGAYYGSRLFISVLFVIGVIFSYYLHSRHIIRDVPY